MLQHFNPVWRKKADYVIGATISDPDWSEEYEEEQLAARELEDGTFEICCIPFMVYDLFLGDIVTLDEELNVKEIVKRSGHLGFRVIVNHSKKQLAKVVDLLEAEGCLTETHNDWLSAIDAVDEKTAHRIADLLARLEKDRVIVEYETIATG